MKTLTKAERQRLTAAVLYPEDEEAWLSLGRVAEMTNRDIRVIRHFVKKDVLPAEKLPNGRYRVQAKNVAIVLWQPAWGEKRPIHPGDRRLRRTVVPGSADD